MAWEQLAALMEKYHSSSSRSTILKEIRFALIILVGAFLALIKMNADPSYLIFFVGLILFFVFLFGFAYIYCLLKNPDALRTEEHIERTMAIKKGFLGDNLFGFLTSKKEKNINNITPDAQSVEEDNSK